MTANLYEAHQQWLTRPADERFPSLEELYNFTASRKAASTQATKQLRSLHLDLSPDDSIILNGESSPVYFSNWAFSQLCGRIGAPASYIRSLSPGLARECLQYGVERSTESCKVLIRRNPRGNGDDGEKYASAFTGPSYGRIWDADVAESLLRGVEGSAWHVPQARSIHGSENSGLYASDHDMFAFFVNDERPVEVGNARLGKGFFCWNSETGSSTFGLTTFLYNYVCGNHIVWGSEQVNQLRIIHRKQAPAHFYMAAIPMMNEFLSNKRIDDYITDKIGTAMLAQIGPTLDKAIQWFDAKPFTKREVSLAWETGQENGEDTTTLWGMVQGLTAVARDYQFADKRVDLERRAGSLLKAV